MFLLRYCSCYIVVEVFHGKCEQDQAQTAGWRCATTTHLCCNLFQPPAGGAAADGSVSGSITAQQTEAQNRRGQVQVLPPA